MAQRTRVLGNAEVWALREVGDLVAIVGRTGRGDLVKQFVGPRRLRLGRRRAFGPHSSQGNISTLLSAARSFTRFPGGEILGMFDQVLGDNFGVASDPSPRRLKVLDDPVIERLRRLEIGRKTAADPARDAPVAQKRARQHREVPAGADHSLLGRAGGTQRRGIESQQAREQRSCRDVSGSPQGARSIRQAPAHRWAGSPGRARANTRRPPRAVDVSQLLGAPPSGQWASDRVIGAHDPPGDMAWVRACSCSGEYPPAARRRPAQRGQPNVARHSRGLCHGAGPQAAP
jgi:hypothetical protein